MTREQAIAELQVLQKRLDDRECDEEKTHPLADDVLCKLLTALGYADVVAEFEALPKWYS